MLTGAHMTIKIWQLHLIREDLMVCPSQTHLTLRACLTVMTETMTMLLVLDPSSLLPRECNKSRKVRDDVLQAPITFTRTLPLSVWLMMHCRGTLLQQ